MTEPYAPSKLTVSEVWDRLEEAIHGALCQRDLKAKFTYADAGAVHLVVSDLLREVLPYPWKQVNAMQEDGWEG